MKAKISITLYLVTVFCATTYGQEYEPLVLARKIFDRSSAIDLKHYVTGEYLGHPNGKDLIKDVSLKFMLLGQTTTHAVINLTILDSLGRGMDTYLHFEKDPIWKMSAFRALAMTGTIEGAIKELEAMTPAMIEAQIKNKREKKAGFESMEEYDFLLGNAKLILQLDDQIILHFIEHKEAFEKIKDEALKDLKKDELGSERSIKLAKGIQSDFKKLFISDVSTGGYELGKCIKFLIGGILDNTVGYFFITDEKDLPLMSDNRIIMIRAIGNGWYLYKTT